jgi:hypothetical protein
VTARDENARFEELMSREFPDGLVPVERARPILDEDPPEPPPPPDEEQSEPAMAAQPADSGTTEPTPEPAEGFRSWAPPEEPDEPFVPPTPPPAARWTSAGIAGTVLVVLPLVLVLLTVFGLRLPMVVSVLAGAGFIVGVVLLLQRLRKRPPIDGDGAVV